MMDTVRLVIDCDVSLVRGYRLSPFKRISYNKGFLQSWVEEEDYGGWRDCYHPIISYMERPIGGGFTHELVIEASFPQLLFGNNAEEVREKDLYFIVQAIHGVLLDLDFGWLSVDDIMRARVSRVDVCKNIILDGRIEAANIIRSLKMANLGGAHKQYERVFDGGGMMAGWRLKMGEDITFYDKTAEMSNRSKRTSLPISKSVLRFEVKLQKAKTIKNRLKAAGVDVPDVLTLESLFKDDICRALVLHEFNKVYDRVPKADLDTGIWQLAQNIAAEEQGKRGGYTRWLKRVACAVLRQEAPDGASLDRLVEDAFKKHSKYAMHKIRDGPTSGQQFKKLIAVKRNIEEFRPLTAADLEGII